MTRIGRVFQDKRKVLVAYITAGDPTPDRTPALVAALERGGADLIELGVPFSDPVADGPVIMRAGERALRAGTTVAKVLGIAREIRRTSEIPILLFTYLNPVIRYGLDRLAADAKASGIDGCLLTDASVEEAGSYVDAMRGAGLDTVFLAAPTSTERRLQLVAKYSSGFVYLVSRTGVTGEPLAAGTLPAVQRVANRSVSPRAGFAPSGGQNAIFSSVKPLIQALRRVTKLPLAVGFGVSRPEHVAEIGAVAGGVV